MGHCARLRRGRPDFQADQAGTHAFFFTLAVIFESFSIHQSPINVALGSNGLPLSRRFALPRAMRLRLRSCLAETATSEDDFSGEPPSFVGCEKGSDQSDVFRYAGST